MQIAQAIRVFDLAPCSELRFDLRFNNSKQQQQQQQTLPPPCLTVRLEPRDNTPVRADWFGFSTTTASGGSKDTMSFRLGCSVHGAPASTALFTPSGCLVTVEGPATVVQKCISLAFFERDTSLRPSAIAAAAAEDTSAIQQQQQAAWPLWRRQVAQLHSVLHEARLSAFRASEEQVAGGGGGGAGLQDGGNGQQQQGQQQSAVAEDEDASMLKSIGPRVLVIGSRSGCGRTTICRTLINLATRDGFQPLFVAADPSGTSLVGQPGCYAACFADAGIDPTEAGAHFPTVQVALPLADCPKNKLAEPCRHSIATLIEMADRRTFSVKSCAAAGLIIDTDAVDEVLLDDELERIVAIIEECTIETVIVVGSENLRQSLRFRLQREDADRDKNNNGGGGGANNNNPFINAFGGGGHQSRDGDYSSQSMATRREELSRSIVAATPDAVIRVQRLDGSTVALHSCVVVDGAEDRSCGTASSSVLRQAKWNEYFFGTATTPLSSFAQSVPVSSAKWVVLKSQSTDAGGLLPLQGAGEETKTEYRASAEVVNDLSTRFAAHNALQQSNINKSRKAPFMAAVLRVSPNASVDALIDSDALCKAPVVGFVAVTNVAADGSTVDILTPNKVLPPNCVFALLHQTAQP